MTSTFKLNQQKIVFGLFSMLFLASCQKENSRDAAVITQEQEASFTSCESDAEAVLIFNGVFDDVMGVNNEVGMAGVGIFSQATACHTATITRLNAPAAFPVKIVVDFGTTGCTGTDGHTRKGKIITEYTGPLLTVGSIATTVFDGYFIDSIQVTGTHKIKNTSANSTNRQFTVDVIDVKLTKPADFIEWNSHTIITQVEGIISPLTQDDVFTIEGAGRGRVKRGNLLVIWESSIIENLVKKFSCRWLVKGKLKATIASNMTTNYSVAILDFGAGDCDNQGVITVNGSPRQIILR